MLTLREPRSHHSRFALTRVLWASGKKPEIGGGGYGAEALAQPQPEAREEREGQEERLCKPNTSEGPGLRRVTAAPWRRRGGGGGGWNERMGYGRAIKAIAQKWDSSRATPQPKPIKVGARRRGRHTACSLVLFFFLVFFFENCGGARCARKISGGGSMGEANAVWCGWV